MAYQNVTLPPSLSRASIYFIKYAHRHDTKILGGALCVPVWPELHIARCRPIAMIDRDIDVKKY